MQKQNEQPLISTGDRNVEPDVGGHVEEPNTVKYFIELAAHKMATRLRNLEVVKKNPQLIPKINQIEDMDVLYSLALFEQRAGWTKDMNKFMNHFLPQFGLNRREIPADDLAKIQTGIQVINSLFKNKVFTDEKQKQNFRKVKLTGKRKREEDEEEEEDEPQAKKQDVSEDLQ